MVRVEPLGTPERLIAGRLDDHIGRPERLLPLAGVDGGEGNPPPMAPGMGRLVLEFDVDVPEAPVVGDRGQMVAAARRIASGGRGSCAHHPTVSSGEPCHHLRSGRGAAGADGPNSRRAAPRPGPRGREPPMTPCIHTGGAGTPVIRGRAAGHGPHAHAPHTTLPTGSFSAAGLHVDAPVRAS